MNDLTLQERLPVTDATQGQSQSLDLVEYWRAIAKRRWGILGLTLIVAVLAWLIASSIQPTFRATATLLIEQGKNKVVSIEEVYSQGLIQREYYQTQVEILKSEELARKVIQRLNLTTNPDYDPRQAEPNWISRLLGLDAGVGAKPSDEDVLKAVVRRFKTNLQVQLVRNSQLAQITFVSPDKELAAKVP